MESTTTKTRKVLAQKARRPVLNGTRNKDAAKARNSKKKMVNMGANLTN